tara:strand:- start:1531 stop:1938 length:408 start_codon:yes stop_codon:yes gene_type:complete
MTQRRVTIRNSSIIQQIKKAGITYVDAGWRKFSIVFLEVLEDTTGEDLYGSVNFDKGTLNLNVSLLKGREETTRETLLHEITHILLDITGLGGPSDSEKEKEIQVSNEDLTTRISRGFLLFKNLNPELAEIIFNG